MTAASLDHFDTLSEYNQVVVVSVLLDGDQALALVSLYQLRELTGKRALKGLQTSWSVTSVSWDVS
jgi:hypothetical protein